MHADPSAVEIKVAEAPVLTIRDQQARRATRRTLQITLNQAARLAYEADGK